MRSQHFYSCLACGKQDSCGDCIPTYCSDCEAKIRHAHHGVMPRFFPSAADDCPCSDCRSRRADHSIIEKLIAEIKRLKALYEPEVGA